MTLEQASLLAGCVSAAIAMAVWYSPRMPLQGSVGALCTAISSVAFAIAFVW